MKIKHIVVWDEDLGNTKPYTIAFKTIDEVRNVFVEITLENGITGIGAANPSEYVTGESFDSCLHVLQGENLEFLKEIDIREFYWLHHKILKQFPENPAARAALDIAIHDAFTKYLDIPLVKFLGEQIESLPTSVTVGIKNVEDTLREAREHFNKGFKILKIKLGKDLEEDIERLIKLREKFGYDTTIRVDANQGYTVQQTLDFYKRTIGLKLELIEQPLPADAVNEMKELPEDIRKKLAADESLLSQQDALTLVDSCQATGIFNIKLMKCGGIHEALKIADIAAAKDIDLFWGCNDESIISITAALHAAFACAHTKYIDLDGSFDLAHDVVYGGFRLEDGYMYCLDKPGLGVSRK